MKKVKQFLFASLIFAMTLFTSKVDAQSKNYKPYVNTGVSVSSGITSVGGELGVYNAKAWYAIGYSQPVTIDAASSLSAKGYWKLTNTKTDNDVDVFAQSAINLSLDQYHAISLEPGASVVFNIWKRFAPQISLTFPIQENSVLRGKSLAMNAGVSLNYWIQ